MAHSPHFCAIIASGERPYYFYADDTVIVLKDQTFKGLQDKIDQFIPAMTKWFLSNRLSLNASNRKDMFSNLLKFPQYSKYRFKYSN